MTDNTYPLIGGRTMRVTKEDACGVPAWGDKVFVVSHGFVSVAVAPNYNDIAEVTLPNAMGEFDARRPVRSQLLDETVAVVFTRVQPSIYTAVTGALPVLDRQTGALKGFTKRVTVAPSDIRWGLEVWAEAFEDGCDEDGDLPYGYFGFPSLTGGKFSDYTIENGAVSFGITEARTRGGAGWGVGPYLVDTDETGAPDALGVALTKDDHETVFLTTVAPPEVTDGFLPLDDPDGVAATTATAGTPGHFNGVRPLHLAGMSSVTASPTTTWTTGQSVILGDGSDAHWITGSPGHWAAGKA